MAIDASQPTIVNMITLLNTSHRNLISHILITNGLVALILATLLLSNTVLADDRKSDTKLIIADQHLGQHLEPELTAGRWQLVMFWTTWCSVCKTDFKRLQAFLKERPELKLDLMGVAFDGIKQEAKARSLVQKHNLHYTHILTTKKVASEYYLQSADVELVGPPSYLLFDKDNQLAAISANAIDLESLDLFLD